jgi:hypothetical protein
MMIVNLMINFVNLGGLSATHYLADSSKAATFAEKS